MDLPAGGMARVEFVVMRWDVSFWDVAIHQWTVPNGEFVVRAGFSSRDQRLEGRVTL